MVIDRVTLSSVDLDVLLTGSPCQQSVLMVIDRVTLSAMGLMSY